MITRIAVVLTLLLVACGSDSGDDSGIRSTDDNILHLSSVDVSGDEARRMTVELFAQAPEAKRLVCSLTAQGKDAFVAFVDLGDDLYERGQASAPTTGTPKPGQKAERASQERFYEIVSELCQAR